MKPIDVIAHPIDASYDFMARDERKPGVRQFPRHDVKISAAYAASGDTDAHLMGARLRVVTLDVVKRFAAVPEFHRLHV
jgi:hypothetical protein